MVIEDQEADSLNGKAVPTKLKQEVQRFRVCWETLPATTT